MHITKINSFLKSESFENRTFYLGIFLLLSTPAIASLLLIFSVLINQYKIKDSYFKDYWNIPFFFASIFMLFSCIVNTIKSNSSFSDIYDINLTWIGLFNWIPYFYCFWLFKNFTSTSFQRKKILIYLLLGSLPLFITGYLQYFFKINGPFTFLFGLLKWYSRPIENYDGLSGLFNNANYAGTWLNIILPVSITFALEKKRNLIYKYFSISIFLSVVICTLLTYSRNSWFGFIIGLILVTGLNTLRWLLPLLISISIPVFGSIGIFPYQSIIDFCRKIVPPLIWDYKLISIGFDTFSQYGRFEIWIAAYKFILERPIWGWGAASFPVLFEIKTDLWKGHAHNLPLELAVSYGIVATLLVFSAVILILIKSKKILLNKKFEDINYDDSWWACSLLILLSQMFDVQYFDIRVGLIFWILLSGLRNIKS